MTTGCIGCGDTSWFQAWDKKEFQPQADGTLKVVMTANGRQAYRFAKTKQEARGFERELCKELGIPYE